MLHCSNADRDLNPLHDIINQCDYKEKYFRSLIPLGLKYAEVTANILGKNSRKQFVVKVFSI